MDTQRNRAGSGRIFRSTKLADNLNPQKARILLALALSVTVDHDEITRLFETYLTRRSPGLPSRQIGDVAPVMRDGVTAREPHSRTIANRLQQGLQARNSTRSPDDSKMQSNR